MRNYINVRVIVALIAFMQLSILVYAAKESKAIPTSNLGKIEKFIAEKMENVGYSLNKFTYGLRRMVTFNYENQQRMLLDQIVNVAREIASPMNNNTERRPIFKKDLANLIENGNMDQTVRNKIKPFVDIILRTTDETMEASRSAYAELLYACRPINQLEILENIQQVALDMVYNATEEEFPGLKQKLIDLCNSERLYQKIKDEIAPDIEIILKTTDETKALSKEAFGRLKNNIDKRKSYVSQISQYPLLRDMAVTSLGGLFVGKLLSSPLQNWLANYRKITTQSKVYDSILDQTYDAAAHKDWNKYHQLMGTLEPLGVQIDETYKSNGEIDTMNFHLPKK